jgi:hypothetical protein
MHKDIFDFIKKEEGAYELPIEVIDGYEWSMKEHIRLTVLYKNSQFSTGNDKKSRDDKPFKNIVLPILRLQYRTEGFDVKDIALYIDDPYEYYKSFLAKKYHEEWATEEEIDTFIDDMVESYVDFGGSLIKDVNKKKPETVPLQSIAFCDQSNMLGGPMGLRHNYAPDELLAFKDVGWGNEKNGATATLEDAIMMAQEFKTPDPNKPKEVKTPGKYIETYEVHGMMPESWLRAGGSDDKYVRQMHIVCFYKDENDEKQGITLFKGKEKESPFKQVLRDKIYGRALGLGGVEELFDAQVWTNYGEIVKKGMLDQAAKVFFQTASEAFKNKNKNLSSAENGQVFVHEEGKPVTQLSTTPVNISLFEKLVNEWQAHGQLIGAANDAILGETPPSGTPFKLQELVTMQSGGLHQYRQGKLSTFMVTVYTDWVMPHIETDISKGKKFLAELSLDELEMVAESVVTCAVNNRIKKKMHDGKLMSKEQVELLKSTIRAEFMKRGSKRFIEIFKGEMADLPKRVKISIAGKQKDLSRMTDKLVNIFRQIIANPAVLDDPRMAKLLAQIIEASGLSPIDFGLTIPRPPQAQPTPSPAEVVPKKDEQAVYQ